jgi:ferredoxin--NADP+ reductase|tara:strand:- start:3591 stop:4895 length:1305 start_codon:yes stop_codon:yes gene_type:complete
LSKNNNHFIAIIGGAVSGSTAASTLLDKGYKVAIIEQNARPYGKIEDGLPIWHQKQREQEYAKIDQKLDHPNLYFIPNTKLGTNISFDELTNKIKFSAIILAIGAWKDRPLPLKKSDSLINKGLIYQNKFIYWFNHREDINSLKENIQVIDGAIIIGGGLASIDVAKACQIELFIKAVREIKNIILDVEEIETNGIPKTCEKIGIAYKDLNIKGSTILYRRTATDMPLADIPDNATVQMIEKIKNVRSKILQKAKDKFLFNFEELSTPNKFLIKNGKINGIQIKKTELVDGKLIVTHKTKDIQTTQVISSIGSIPEPIEGIMMEGETYKVKDKNLGIYTEIDGIFLTGNVVTGKGNIRDSLKHAEKVSAYVANQYLSPLNNDLEDTAVKKVENFLAQKKELSNADLEIIQEKIIKLQSRVNYHNNYKEWISASQ